MSISRCLICNKNATQEYASKNGYDYYKCDNCGFLFADLHTRRSEIEGSYHREHFFFDSSSWKNTEEGKDGTKGETIFVR